MRAVIICALLLLSTPAFAQDQPREPWNGAVVGVQSVSVLAHGVGHLTGLYLVGAVLLSECLFNKECEDRDFLPLQIAGAALSTVGGTLIGGGATYGLGRLMNAPGKVLPTLGLAAAGHGLAAVTALAWMSATDFDDDNAWYVPWIMGTLLGTTGAIVGFQSSF
jgi:hypothetical protein